MKVREVLRLLFAPSGPRRETADRIDEKLAAASDANLDAVQRNLRAVQKLIADTLDKVEGHRNEHDRTSR